MKMLRNIVRFQQSCTIKYIKTSVGKFCSTTHTELDKHDNEPEKKGKTKMDFNVLEDEMSTKQPSPSVQEGKAKVIFPSALNVFYNPVQEFNRDLSIAVLRLFSSDYKVITQHKKSKRIINADEPTEKIWVPRVKENDYKEMELSGELLPAGEKDENGIRILEALSASGLRSLRYAKEIGGIKEIVANDISKAAVECIKTNIEENDVQDLVTPSCVDASLLMYQNKNPANRFEAIDLDPYGSPHTFLDAAVQSVADGGLLLVTSTNMAVLCGLAPETSYTKYGSLSMKHSASHEMALRILLQCIEAHANKYGRYIVPLISASVDFYCRIFVRVFSSPSQCKKSFAKMAWVHQCCGCKSTSFQHLGEIIVNGPSIKYQLSSKGVPPLCKHCGYRHITGGPIWADAIHDGKFIRRLRKTLRAEDFNTYRRMDGVLALMEEELPYPPLYLRLDRLSKVTRMLPFKQVEFTSAMLNAGYQVSPTHACVNAIKTDAPMDVVWDFMRTRDRVNPIKKDRLEDDPGKKILSTEPSTKIDFTEHPDAKFPSQKQGLLRYQMNPNSFWGPKSKGKTFLVQEDREK